MDVFKHPTVRELAALARRARRRRGPRPLLHGLTPPGAARRTVVTYVCVPYGGGSAVVYQPLADALPAGHALWSVAIPGHDVGLDEDRAAVRRAGRPLRARDPGEGRRPPRAVRSLRRRPAVTVELARRLEAAGRELDAVYIGGDVPVRPAPRRVCRGCPAPGGTAAQRPRYVNWLKSQGVDMDELDPAQADRIVGTCARDSAGRGVLHRLFDGRRRPAARPGDQRGRQRDPATDYYQERYREWRFLTTTSAVVVLDEAGHFFLRYRAEELAEIVTTHPELSNGPEDGLRDPGATWWLQRRRVEPARPAPRPARTAGGRGRGRRPAAQHAALPRRRCRPAHLHHRHGADRVRRSPCGSTPPPGRWAEFALLAVLGLVPGLLGAPLAGAIVDRTTGAG